MRKGRKEGREVEKMLISLKKLRLFFKHSLLVILGKYSIQTSIPSPANGNALLISTRKGDAGRNFTLSAPNTNTLPVITIMETRTQVGKLSLVKKGHRGEATTEQAVSGGVG